MGFLDSTFVLTKKTTLILLRDSAALGVTLVAAFLSMLVLYFSQLSLNSETGFGAENLDTPNPAPMPLTTIPRCVPSAHPDCYTLAYVPSSNDRVNAWVTAVAAANSIPANETRGFEDDDALNAFLVAQPNRTQAAYIFDTASLQAIAANDVSYIVQFNETEQYDFPLASTDFFPQVVIPSMIHHMNLVLMRELSDKTVDISLSTSIFPHPPVLANDGSPQGLDAFGRYGDVLTFSVYFLSLVLFLYKIVQEKERGLRDAMRLAGQQQWQHYFSWCVPYLIVNFLLTLLMIAFGRAFGFKIFSVNRFEVPFLTMWIFSLSLIGWTMFFATVLRSSPTVSSVSFNIFIFGYLFASSGGVVYVINEDGTALVSDSTLFLRELFATIPSVMYIKALNDASRQALLGNSLTISTVGSYVDVFPIRTCWLWMLGSGAVGFVLSIYLDNVLPSEHGVPLSPFYLFKPSYWFPPKEKALSLETMKGDTGTDTDSDRAFAPVNTQVYNPDCEDADVRAEREAVANGERDTAGLLIKNVSRVFRKMPSPAVDDVSFSVKRNTAFALLGHNGAGKSTLFKMIVTSLKPTTGDAFVYGLSVRNDKEQVRRLLGVCPQFDMYWDHLTGAEHIEVFSSLRGYVKEQRGSEITTRLMDVKLSDKANIVAGEYSGGMQRRLSVALALTGDPKIILLDECTSGADPLVRRDIWGAIQRAKEGRVIFLITHSIAEAQHIAGHNRIGIMAKGKLRVLGNALHLKSKFGAGYGLVVAIDSLENARRLGNMLEELSPRTQLSSWGDSETGDLLAKYELPRDASDAQVLRMLEMIEERKAELGVREYSINSTSLGEVFKSITSLSEDVREQADLEEEQEKKEPTEDDAPGPTSPASE